MRSDARGVALIDVVASTALAVTAIAMAVPLVGRTLVREHALTGAHYLAGQAQHARFEALRRSTSVALQVLVVGERTSIRLFADGNGNGVLQRDIDRGLDPPLTEAEWLDVHAAGVSLRLNQDVADIGGAGSLAKGDDPLRIGRTSLVVFSPLGGTTTGTLYVAATQGPQLAIRLYGATGRLRVLWFNDQTRQWQP